MDVGIENETVDIARTPVRSHRQFNFKLLSRKPMVEIANNAKTSLRIPSAMALLQQSRRIEIAIKIQRSPVPAWPW
jgi:hypothetical protein